MTQPTCARCDCTIFELEEATDIKGANFAHAIVRCSNCGAPIGVLEDENTSAGLAEQDAKLADLCDGVGRLEVALKNVLAELRQLCRDVNK